MKSIKSVMLWSYFTVASLFMLLLVIILVFHFSIVSKQEQLNRNFHAENTIRHELPELVESYYLYVSALQSREREEIYLSFRENITGAIGYLDENIKGSGSRIAYASLRKLVMSIIEDCDQGVEHAKNGDLLLATEHYNSGLYRKFFVMDAVAKLTSEEVSALDKTMREVEKSQQIGFTMLMGVIAVIILAGIALSSYFANHLTEPITELSNIAKEVSSGKLEKTAGKKLTDRSDEFGILSTSLNEMILKLNAHIDELNKSTRETLTSRKQLSKKNTELEKFQELAVGRELKMIELKKEIEGLKKKKSSGRRISKR